ncbi:MAG TPA: ATP-binding protein [Candidatus Dormibacteraeota bacterium]|nr:ATP-binding protein [Candidatus Dormibacteraeota bacterium]
MAAPELHGLESRLLAIFDSVADGVTVLDRTGVIRFANDAASQLMGYDRADEIIGRSSAELVGRFEILDPEGQPFAVELLPTRRAFSGESAVEAVVRFRHSGTLLDRWSIVRARLLPAETPDGDLVVSAFQDITALKQSEIRLRVLSEVSALLSQSIDYEATLAAVAGLAVPDLADWCVVDVVEPDVGVHRVATAHADESKRKLAEDVERRWPSDPEAPGGINEVIRSGRSVHAPEVTDEMLRASAKDKEHLEILRSLNIRSALIVPLVARGQILGAMTLVSESQRTLTPDDVALAEEVGRRAGAAIDASRLLSESEQSIRMRDDFMAVASHDMRTPLAAVRGYAQLARRHLAAHPTPDIAALDRWLTDIDDAAGRLTALVAEFMDASLVRGGHAVPLQPERTDLVPLVRHRVKEHRRTTDGHRLIVRKDAASLIGDWDPPRLGRVLDNLLSNAIKFSPNGGDIVVRVGGKNGRGFVAVTDHGIGITRSDLNQVFSPMFRGANATRVTGAGLGLFGARKLVEQMGGTIEVTSELGSGSTFKIWLPLSD